MAQSAVKHNEIKLSDERAELTDRIAKSITENGVLDILPDVTVARSAIPTQPIHSVFRPAFCVIAQGSKNVFLGDEHFRYGSGNYLISTVDLPIVSHVAEASVEKPYLSFRLDLEPKLVASVMVDAGLDIKAIPTNAKAMDVSALDADLLNAVVRIMRLVDRTDEQRALLPLIKREIVFRLLKGNQGARLAHLIAGGEDRRISKAIHHLTENFARPLRMEDVARDLGMSISGFHHQFKSVTAMSPLQFQKQIRLQEARRLMLGEDIDAASAAFRVGYEDPSYFSRDYKRHFGAPPQRDITRLRSEIAAN